MFGRLRQKTNKLYFTTADTIPDDIDPKMLQSKSVVASYPNAPVATLYLPENNGSNPRAFHFVLTPDGWKLLFADDSLCST